MIIDYRFIDDKLLSYNIERGMSIWNITDKKKKKKKNIYIYIYI